MSYMNAPATKMIATRCAVCARSLVDAKSVESGIGPDCRKKYGFDDVCSEADRVKANALVYQIACIQKGEEALEACRELDVLGFKKLADRIAERLTRIRIRLTDDNRLSVVAPYNVNFVYALAKIPGRKWNKKAKANTFPNGFEPKLALYKALSSAFEGDWALGPKGLFVIKAAP